jgi:hypothetical protein
VRRRPQAADQRQRNIDQAPAQRAQRQQAGRIGPLQIVHAHHQRSPQCQGLHQIHEGVDRLKL